VGPPAQVIVKSFGDNAGRIGDGFESAGVAILLEGGDEAKVGAGTRCGPVARGDGGDVFPDQFDELRVGERIVGDTFVAEFDRGMGFLVPAGPRLDAAAPPGAAMAAIGWREVAAWSIERNVSQLTPRRASCIICET
jgi:hypothetical protein